MTEREGKEGSLEQIEICFGMVYEGVIGKRSRKIVVVELGDDNYFFGAPILTTNGKELLKSTGTTTLSDIRAVTGEVWPLARVLDAFENGFKSFGGTPKNIIEVLKKEALRPPRILTR